MVYSYPSEPQFKALLNPNDLHSYFMLNKHNNKHIINIDSYFDKWEKVLLETYDKEKNIAFKFKSKYNFYTQIDFSNSHIRIHFSVSKAISFAKCYQFQEVPLYAFSDFDDRIATIKYTKAILNGNFDYENHQAPIIIIPYNFAGFNYLVMDGNHRITAYKNSCKESINAKLLNIESIIPLIDSNFEKAFYFLIYEAANLSYYANNSASQYFINGEFCFE